VRIAIGVTNRDCRWEVNALASLVSACGCGQPRHPAPEYRERDAVRFRSEPEPQRTYSALDALAYVLEGTAEITIDGQPYPLTAGEAILMPANRPHAALAISQFKMLLVMIRS
jgi:quercetin dioxygenase-like cupin family protein